MSRIKAFDPIVGENPRVLILGTMPSVKSLEHEEYYGHGRNQFWKIMGDLFGFERNDDYELRKLRLIEKGIAVWDVVFSCERKGSLDKDIKNAEYNDVIGFIKEHPSIIKVVLNGGKARDIYKKRFEPYLPDVEIIALYSTSPANAISYERKFGQWKNSGIVRGNEN
ncbi:MAG: DNA-deoxyinosine glycosylase [Peptostreptococcaceae bacterium]|nr:DNA-deoxyinosine glycosylase [Peptostreptococcaceae bacterium]